jgi:NitT/TauT family transport system substrate-binding protein
LGISNQIVDNSVRPLLHWYTSRAGHDKVAVVKPGEVAMKGFGIAGLLLALLAPTVPAGAGEPVNLILNWAPTADHSPFYYAKAQGWYEKAGIDLTIETGKGSGVSSLKVGSGGSPFGIADLATMLVARSKGADVVALMSIYANTGQTFYWLKSYGVNGPKDFPGHKIGNPPGDASRVMWPAFAKAAGIAPDAVNFVNVGPTAKIAALKSHTVDIISDFYNEHDLKVIEFGADLGYVNWKDIGLNPYGNSLIVNGAYLEKNPKLAEDFVKISQKAFAACVADVAPCLKALLDAASGLDKENQERQWERIKFLMTDDFTTTKALGWIDAERMKKDYELVQTYLGMEKPFAVETAFSTKLLDTSIKMDASKVKK